MIVFLVLLIVAVFHQVAFSGANYNENFFSKDKTNAIKGFFIIIVFINHIKEYYVSAGADLTAWYDMAFFLPAKALGQLMVVMFLFYSGYGVAESIKKKGDEYIQKIPKRRVLGTLLNFDVAVVIFAITCLLIGRDFSFSGFLLSLVGWEDVGNSNWYIFCILVCYALTYISYRIHRKMGGAILFASLIVYTVVMSCFKGTWWYNTVFAYGIGVIFSEHKDNLIFKIQHHYLKSLILLAIGFIACLGCYLFFYVPFKTSFEQVGAFVFNIMSVFFALLIIVLTMKISIGNKILYWLGSNLFPLYIYQRLPMMIFLSLCPNTLIVSHPYFFLIACVVITGVIAWGYKFFRIKVA